MLRDDEKMTIDEKKLVKRFNDHYINIGPVALNLKKQNLILDQAIKMES